MTVLGFALATENDGCNWHLLVRSIWTGLVHVGGWLVGSGVSDPAQSRLKMSFCGVMVLLTSYEVNISAKDQLYHCISFP